MINAMVDLKYLNYGAFKGSQRIAAARVENELRQVRIALSDLKQRHLQMKSIFGKEVQCCQKQIAVSLNPPPPTTHSTS